MNNQPELDVAPYLPALKIAKIHAECAVIALKHTPSSAVVKVATDHLEQALAALKPTKEQHAPL